ncbi:MAG TPA: hypothetical protein VGR08_13025 [Thermomicrobiales bacterium]|nr:hypothetical protein [Thermomicrobiales bacterium]
MRLGWSAASDARADRPPSVPPFDAAGCERLRDLLHRSPRDFGKPTSVWTLALVAEVCAEAGITSERASHETIRNTLRRLEVRWQRAKDWIVSPDPAYAQQTSGVIG